MSRPNKKDKKGLRSKFKAVKLLALDFDGIFTDGTVFVNQDGIESVRCSRTDGFGIEMLRNASIYVCVISGEPNPVVKARCNKLKIDCWTSVEKGGGKLEIIKRVAAKRGVALSETAYMGDDLIDILVLRTVGLPISVPNAHPEAQKIAKYITKASGGWGAIREIAELILKAKGYNLMGLVAIRKLPQQKTPLP